MNIKIKTALLFAIVMCLCVIFVSCGEAESEATAQPPVCTVFADENNDGICDNCNHAMTVEKEENEPTVTVKPIPDGVVESDYFSFDYNGASAPKNEYTKLDGAIIQSSEFNNGRIAVLKYAIAIDDPNVPESERQQKDYFDVYDVKAKKKLHSFSSEAYKIDGGAPNDTYTFILEEYYFCVSKSYKKVANINGTEFETFEHSWRFYTNSGDGIGNFTSLEHLSSEVVNGVEYITINNTVVPVDIKTFDRVRLAEGGEVVYGDADTFIKRPAFDKIYGNYGYSFIKDENGNFVGFQVFDLTKWIDCIYAYTAYGYVEESLTVMGVLEDKKVLVQTCTPLHSTSEYYDFIKDGVKYNIVYTAIDPFEGTEAELELGYYIESIIPASDSKIATDLAVNLAKLTPVVNSYLDGSETFLASVDNELNILCALKKLLPGQKEGERVALGGGLYTVSVDMGRDNLLAVVDENGAFVAYLPEDYFAGDGFVLAGKRIYGYDMKEKFNLANNGDEYSIVVLDPAYMILSKPNPTDVTKLDYFYYNPTLQSPTLIATEGGEVLYYGLLSKNLFMTREIYLVEPINNTVIYKYNIYNSNNTKLFDFTAEPELIGEYGNSVLVKISEHLYVFS